MTDYTRSTGTSATMMIRDTGSYVEFWLNSNNSSSFNNQLPWGYIINGANVGSLEFRYEAGAGWQRFGRWLVTTTQTVTFKIGDTGTGGIGGPTNLSATIDRANPPNPPTIPTATAIGSTAISLKFTYGAPNGAAVTGGQISYTTNPGIVAEHVVNANGSATITGLVRGGTYWFRARNVNSEGWSGWSSQSVYTLLDYPDQGSPVSFTEVKQTSVKASITPVGNGGAAIDSYQILWSLLSTPESGDFDVVSVPQAPYTYLITGLLPGKVYNVWSRPHNSVGWGPWSPTRSVKTLPGAYVKVGSVWKEAVPYVKVGGVWKVARPWIKVAGTWRESI